MHRYSDHNRKKSDSTENEYQIQHQNEYRIQHRKNKKTQVRSITKPYKIDLFIKKKKHKTPKTSKKSEEPHTPADLPERPSSTRQDHRPKEQRSTQKTTIDKHRVRSGYARGLIAPRRLSAAPRAGRNLYRLYHRRGLFSHF